VNYYIQRHASGYVGNCLLWWRKGGNGYTCNLDDAEVFDGDNAKFQSIAKDGSKYTAWEKNYIDACAHRHVDHQYVDDALKGIRATDATRVVCVRCGACAGHPEDREGGLCRHCGERRTVEQTRTASGEWVTLCTICHKPRPANDLCECEMVQGPRTVPVTRVPQQ